MSSITPAPSRAAPPRLASSAHLNAKLTSLRAWRSLATSRGGRAFVNRRHRRRARRDKERSIAGRLKSRSLLREDRAASAAGAARGLVEVAGELFRFAARGRNDVALENRHRRIPLHVLGLEERARMAAHGVIDRREAVARPAARAARRRRRAASPCRPSRATRRYAAPSRPCASARFTSAPASISSFRHSTRLVIGLVAAARGIGAVAHARRRHQRRDAVRVRQIDDAPCASAAAPRLRVAGLRGAQQRRRAGRDAPGRRRDRRRRCDTADAA